MLRRAEVSYGKFIGLSGFKMHVRLFVIVDSSRCQCKFQNILKRF